MNSFGQEQDEYSFLVSQFFLENRDFDPKIESDFLTIKTLDDVKISVSNLIRNLIYDNLENYYQVEAQTQQNLNKIFDSFQINQQQLSGNKRRKRGPYQTYPFQIKQQAISQYQDVGDAKKVSMQMRIPRQNLKRWLDNGIIRREGAGRKMVAQKIEDELIDWCLSEGSRLGQPVSRLMMQQKALELSKDSKKFKASKGWIDKFVKKHNLRQRVTQELKEAGCYKKKRLQVKPIEPSVTTILERVLLNNMFLSQSQVGPDEEIYLGDTL